MEGNEVPPVDELGASPDMAAPPELGSGGPSPDLGAPEGDVGEEGRETQICGEMREILDSMAEGDEKVRLLGLLDELCEISSGAPEGDLEGLDSAGDLGEVAPEGSEELGSGDEEGEKDGPPDFLKKKDEKSEESEED
jgi:hypothetical protein